MANQFKRMLIAATVVAGVSAIGSSASAAPVLPDFTIDINAVSTVINTPTLFVADKFTGNYNEVLTITGANTFSTVAYWDMGQIVTNDGQTPILVGTKLNVDYSIYAVFSSDGTFTPNGAGFDFSGSTGSISLFLDQNLDSNPKVLPGSAPGAITIPNTGDDKLLASATLLSGSGHENATDPLASGDYGLLFNPFNLTTLGGDFFVAPRPFYLQVTLKGQFNSFVPVGNQFINGSADAFFNDTTVPEPATLGLLGVGLLGTAMVRRRRKA